MAFLVGFEFCNIGFSLSRHHEDFCLLFLDSFAHLFHVSIAAGSTSFVDVANIKHGFRRQQKEIARCLLLFLRFEANGAGILALLKHLLVGLQHIILNLGVLVAAHRCELLHLRQAALNGLQVLELQFCIYNGLVSHRVDGAVNMDNVVVVEATEHVDNGVRLSDITQKLVA